jgi:hypothetical protein
MGSNGDLVPVEATFGGESAPTIADPHPRSACGALGYRRNARGADT